MDPNDSEQVYEDEDFYDNDFEEDSGHKSREPAPVIAASRYSSPAAEADSRPTTSLSENVVYSRTSPSSMSSLSTRGEIQNTASRSPEAIKHVAHATVAAAAMPSSPTDGANVACHILPSSRRSAAQKQKRELSPRAEEIDRGDGSCNNSTMPMHRMSFGCGRYQSRVKRVEHPEELLALLSTAEKGSLSLHRRDASSSSSSSCGDSRSVVRSTVQPVKVMTLQQQWQNPTAAPINGMTARHGLQDRETVVHMLSQMLKDAYEKCEEHSKSNAKVMRECNRRTRHHIAASHQRYTCARSGSSAPSSSSASSSSAVPKVNNDELITRRQNDNDDDDGDGDGDDDDNDNNEEQEVQEKGSAPSSSSSSSSSSSAANTKIQQNHYDAELRDAADVILSNFLKRIIGNVNLPS